ncbi:hypothetical protein JRO89_XS08G0123700 [Xanthoceras sorbifolium]|uniref:Uncharacterized protein n=1 Tax=Xanthoceras sorbifolium TaxID=99658 RepID=A0ABQ8HPN2_9ROSI|nr:hypothetical protein JRO89_XS08G0123700 [Xanthoceras sorbifolium]
MSHACSSHSMPLLNKHCLFFVCSLQYILELIFTLVISCSKEKKERRPRKKGRKIKKREKKEKEKKEKDKSRGNGKVESKQLHHKKRHKDKRSQENKKRRHLQNKTKNEKEQLENSGLTKEHGHAVGSQNSSDSTLNSQKRLKLSSSPDVGHNSGKCLCVSPLCWRANYFVRQKDPKVLLNKEQPCSASGMTDNASIQVMHEPALRPGKEREEHPCSTSTKGCSEEETALVTSLYGICPPDFALKFRDLIGNWVPPRVQSECIDFDNEEWLFELKHNQKSRRSKEDVVVSSHANTTTTCPRLIYMLYHSRCHIEHFYRILCDLEGTDVVCTPASSVE